MFLLAAAGKISIEFIIKIPTQRIETITIEATKTINKFSTNVFFIPLLFASDAFKLIAYNLFENNIQNIKTSTAITNKVIISDGTMLKISPIK